MPAEQWKNQTTDDDQDGGASGTKTTSLTPRPYAHGTRSGPGSNGTDGQTNNEKGNRNVKVGG